MAKDAPRLPPPCSSLRMTYLGVGQPARPVCSHVCLCMCSLFLYPACWGTNTLWLNLSSFLPSDDTLVHENGEVGAEGREVWRVPATSEKHVSAWRAHGCVRVIRSKGPSVRVMRWEMKTAVSFYQKEQSMNEWQKDGWIREEGGRTVVFSEFLVICGFQLISYQPGRGEITGV